LLKCDVIYIYIIGSTDAYSYHITNDYATADDKDSGGGGAVRSIRSF